MPKINLSHFEASMLFALLTSIVLGVVTKRTDRERVRYAGVLLRLVRRRHLRIELADVPGPRVKPEAH